jgi:hypothetical protein
MLPLSKQEVILEWRRVKTVCFWSYSVFAIVWKYALGRQGCRHYTVEERGPYTHYPFSYITFTTRDRDISYGRVGRGT